MACWPRDERDNIFTTEKHHGQVKDHTRNYPNLEQGLIGAATLLEKDKRLHWAFATTESQHSKGSSTNTLISGKQVEIFPPSRPFPLLQVPATIHQRAEQGANFLRTYLPDIDIAAELIRDQLVEETTLSRELEQFDPYVGNLLGVHNTQDVSLLFFPMGETYRELNISSAKFGDAIVFKPSAVLSHTFPTPIQQIAIAKSDPSCPQDVRIAVRTFSFTKLLKLHTWSEFDPNYKLMDLATLSRADMCDEVIVDMKHVHSSHDVLAVGDKGTVYQWHVSNARQSTSALNILTFKLEFNANATLRTLVHNARKSSSAMDDCRFWRLSLDPSSSSYLLMASKHVIQGDIRVKSKPPNQIFSIASGKHSLTSIEDLHQDGLFRLCSTNQIIWMDPRMPGKHVLAYCHGRQYDRYLATETYCCNSNNAFTLLKSRNNGLITVYDVSQSQSNLVSMNAAPYPLSTGGSLYDKHDGQEIVVHNHGFGLIRLSERGGLSYNALAFDTLEEHTPVVEWTAALQELETKTTTLRPDAGPLGHQERSQVNFFSVYDALFRRHYEDAKALEEQSAEATHNLLENFSSYWQRKDMPVEHVLTTYDVAFRAGDEPEHASRADFLTENIINSSRGYRALEQGRLSAEAIKAPWHRSIAQTLSRLDKGFQVDPKEWAKYLQQFDLRNTSIISDQACRYQCTARQQLELDLALSTDVFSEMESKPDDINQALEVMTEALSLSAEPPPVEFGYLRPLERKHANEGAEAGEVLGTPDIPMGVRLLLKHWGSGSPESYFYQDPYDSSGATGTPNHMNLPSVPPSVQDSVTRRPPQVMASKQPNVPFLPDTLRGLRSIAQSQGSPPRHGLSFDSPLFSAQPLLSASQDLVNTQVLPGPHGGRPSIKKKAVKKRVGGF
ncbi:hypothetical protein BYT27DRAFT_7203813 [Phlegmacium glaucopus]|nr:hypothetical protein BYT27DRAFT_7203813 [Phlegmacium glaucopus]